jgi:hypothetical protein
MNNNLVEQAGNGTEVQRQEDLPSGAGPAVGELSQAVGKYALLQAQVGVKIAAHIIGISDELRSTQNEVESLRARMDKLDRDLAPRKRTPQNSSR